MCKQPFGKKPKAEAAPRPVAAPAPAPTPADPNPLQGLSKEQLEKLDAANLLKKDAEEVPSAPPWMRPLAYAMMAVWLALACMALRALYNHYGAQAKGPAIP